MKWMHMLPLLGFILFVILRHYTTNDIILFDILEKVCALLIIGYYYQLNTDYCVILSVAIVFYFIIEYAVNWHKRVLVDNQALNITNTVSNMVATTKHIISGPKIPKIIIQTWKDNNIPKRYWEHIETVKKHNPDYEYKYFTDADIEEFLKVNYPQYYDTYQKLPIKIQKIDFFRYVAVYHYGGFYFDLDMTGLAPLDNLLGYDCVFPIDEIITDQMCKFRRYKPFCDRGYKYLLGQYAFAAAPKHEFIRMLIDEISRNIVNYIKTVDYTSEDYVYTTTGPDFVTNMYIKYQNKSQVYVLNNNMRQYFGDYAKHNYFGTWK